VITNPQNNVIQDSLAAGREVMSETRQKFENAGIDVDYLIGLSKEELAAQETKFIKVKGRVPDRKGRKSFTIVSKTFDETIISVDVINWNIRQNARMDICKLMGLYPASKHDLTSNGKELGNPLTNLEGATRLMFLVEQARKRMKEGKRPGEIVDPGANTEAEKQQESTKTPKKAKKCTKRHSKS